MTQIMIGTIQIRRGPELDLPGQPTQDDPTQPTDGLAPGEMAFTIDTGQVYIGIDPQHTFLTLGRATFPYENIEVLTEASTSTFQNMLGNCLRLASGIHYTSIPFDMTSSVDPNDWRTLAISNDTSAPKVATLGDTSLRVCATVTYFMYDTNDVPLRTGSLSIVSSGSTLTPLLSDDCVHFPRTDLTPSDARNVNTLFGSVQFRAAIIADGTLSQVVLQYRNLSQTTLYIMFRIESPTG